ncbi:hypothetical protein [Microbispora sp. CSR-4]|uniref:hypothetical protein n=1 Tax=Microbispora sp. CSR-4 TaxID=2592813 RepID=UPI001C9D2E96|nr:hypothetical protein [Microbispora sp. CSR-4]
MSPFRVSFFRAYVVGTSYAPAALGVFAALLALAEAVAHARGATPLSFGPAATTPPLFGHGSTAPVGMGASTPGTPAGPSTVVVALTGPGADPGGAALRLVAFGLLALATTVPVVFLRTRPTAAALVVGAAGVLSFTAFRTLTVAGAAVVVVCLHRLGVTGARRLGLLLAAPYVVAALLGLPAWTLPRGVAMLVPVEGETRVLVLLLACIAPAATLAGVARRATDEAADNRPPGRSSPAPSWSTPPGASGRASPGSCTTWSPTTSPWSPYRRRRPG